MANTTEELTAHLQLLLDALAEKPNPIEWADALVAVLGDDRILMLSAQLDMHGGFVTLAAVTADDLYERCLNVHERECTANRRTVYDVLSSISRGDGVDTSEIYEQAIEQLDHMGLLADHPESQTDLSPEEQAMQARMNSDELVPIAEWLAVFNDADKARRILAEQYGPRCDEHEPECIVCQAWAAFDAKVWSNQ